MDPYIYEVKLSPELADMLTGMVDLARKNNVLTLTCDRTYGPQIEGYVYDITAGSETQRFTQTTDDAIYALDWVHLIRIGGNLKTIFLTREAYDWVDYERKWRITRWVQRNWHHSKYIFVVVIPALVSIITTILTNSLSSLQIFEILKKLGLIP